jgi:hypothetical protein
MSDDDAQQEYEAALAQYLAAKARLIEAKRHYDHKSDPQAIATRRAKAAEYRAKRKAAWNDPQAKALREQQIREETERMRQWLEAYESRWRA